MTEEEKMKKLSARRLALCGLFSSITAVCSLIAVPLPVPFTLQTLAVFTSLLILGGRYGTISITVWIALGAAGLPVFSGFRGGIGVLTGPTGGYIYGFLLMGLIYHAITGESGKRRVPALVCGLAACYLTGTIHFLLFNGTGITLSDTLMLCVIPFIIPDLVKLTLALSLAKRICQGVVETCWGKPF